MLRPPTSLNRNFSVPVRFALGFPGPRFTRPSSTPRRTIERAIPEWRPNGHRARSDRRPVQRRQVGAWDGNEGAFWSAQARRLDETLANCHGPFLAAAAVHEGDRVLDVGCGTGQATRDVARLATNGSALGVDLSSQMLALARAIASRKGSTTSSSATPTRRSTPSRRRFDVVISRMGSMFFGDPLAAFANLHRALRPEGRLTLLTWQGVADNEWLTEFRAALAVGRDLPRHPLTRPARSRSPTPIVCVPSSAPPASSTRVPELARADELRTRP